MKKSKAKTPKYMSKKLKALETPRKKKIGRPPFEITEEVIKKIEGLASRGLSCDQIAWTLGINPTTLYDKKNRYPQIDEAIEKGRASGIAAVANAHFIAATVGNNTAAQQFYLRTKGGFHEVQKTELTGKDGGPIEVKDAEQSAAREKLSSIIAGIAARAQKTEGNS